MDLIATILCALLLVIGAAAMFGVVIHSMVIRPRRERAALQAAQQRVASWAATRGWGASATGAKGSWRGRSAEVELIANVRRSQLHRFLIVRTWLHGQAGSYLHLAPPDILLRSSVELRLELSQVFPPPRPRLDPGPLAHAGLALEAIAGHEGEAQRALRAAPALERAHVALAPHGLVLFGGRARWEQPAFDIDDARLDAVLDAHADACAALEQALG